MRVATSSSPVAGRTRTGRSASEASARPRIAPVGPTLPTAFGNQSVEE